ncbi:hypothetical protein DL93DRAFT_2169971, partial [Clavulina sp. PMI_390]
MRSARPAPLQLASSSFVGANNNDAYVVSNSTLDVKPSPIVSASSPSGRSFIDLDSTSEESSDESMDVSLPSPCPSSATFALRRLRSRLFLLPSRPLSPVQESCDSDSDNQESEADALEEQESRRPSLAHDLGESDELAAALACSTSTAPSSSSSSTITPRRRESVISLSEFPVPPPIAAFSSSQQQHFTLELNTNFYHDHEDWPEDEREDVDTLLSSIPIPSARKSLQSLALAEDILHPRRTASPPTPPYESHSSASSPSASTVSFPITPRPSIEGLHILLDEDDEPIVSPRAALQFSDQQQEEEEQHEHQGDWRRAIDEIYGNRFSNARVLEALGQPSYSSSSYSPMFPSSPSSFETMEKSPSTPTSKLPLPPTKGYTGNYLTSPRSASPSSSSPLPSSSFPRTPSPSFVPTTSWPPVSSTTSPSPSATSQSRFSRSSILPAFTLSPAPSSSSSSSSKRWALKSLGLSRGRSSTSRSGTSEMRCPSPTPSTTSSFYAPDLSS